MRWGFKMTKVINNIIANLLFKINIGEKRSDGTVQTENDLFNAKLYLNLLDETYLSEDYGSNLGVEDIDFREGVDWVTRYILEDGTMYSNIHEYEHTYYYQPLNKEFTKKLDLTENLICLQLRLNDETVKYIAADIKELERVGETIIYKIDEYIEGAPRIILVNCHFDELDIKAYQKHQNSP